MSFITSIWSTVLEALFPLSSSEEEIYSRTPEQACKLLPPSRPPPLIGASSIFAYKDPRVTKLIWNIKYKKSPQAIAIGGYALHRTLIQKYFGNVDAPNRLANPQRPSLPNLQGGFSLPLIIIPMPITERRRRERGFNQTELLIAKIKRLDTQKQFLIISDLLLRIQHLSRQTDKSRDERLADARGIFLVDIEKVKVLAIENPNLLNITVVIIDDVITTGSTMKEAMETLKNVGFVNVYGLSLAH